MDTSPITARSLQRPYHIKADEFERAYKDFLSGYRTWKELAHADSWLVFYKNIGPHLSIDETALSDGELYTILSNKAAHGGKGTIVAFVKGTKTEDVVMALKHILWFERAKVLEVTMDSHISMNTDNNCEYFIWSKSKGLIQYKYEDGAVYDFYKKISVDKVKR